MSTTQVDFWPSRLMQLNVIAKKHVDAVIFVGLGVVAWCFDPDQIESDLLKTLRWWSMVYAGVMFLRFPIFLPADLGRMIWLSPYLSLTPEGLRFFHFRRHIQLRWDEILVVHEFHVTGSTRWFYVDLIGCFCRDLNAVYRRLELLDDGYVTDRLKRDWPPLMLPTHYLRESSQEIMDAIESYLKGLADEVGSAYVLPTLDRRIVVEESKP